MELLHCSSTSTHHHHFPIISSQTTKFLPPKSLLFNPKFPSFVIRNTNLPTFAKPISFRPFFIKAGRGSLQVTAVMLLYIVLASPVQACAQVRAADSEPTVNKVSEFRDAFWRFLRPHTIRGTALGSCALVARALIENPNLIRWSLVFKAVSGLIALICGNGYIVGINQIYDIGIDKVNKPYLPIAAGDLSVKSAWLLVVMFAIAGLSIVATNYGSFITSLYSLGLFLGTIYSVPPFRMKRFPVVAFLIIATVRGFLLNFGVYYATRAALGLPFEWSYPVIFITTFVTIFALVIAITKDLPDVEGDMKYQISTLATKLGVKKIALLGTGLLLVNYIGSIFAAAYMAQAFRRSLMIPAHTILAMCLVFQAWLLDQAKYSKDAITSFYRFIWNLFYAEYIIFPLL